MTRKRILYITHAYNNRGGVEEHMKALADGIQHLAECHILFPENSRLHHVVDGELLNSYPVNPSPVISPLHEPNTDRTLRTILEKVQPEVIHVMHFLYWPLSLFEVLSGINAKKVISFHDYYPMTPQFTGQGIKDFSVCTTGEYAERVFGRDIAPYLLYRSQLLDVAFKQFEHATVPSKLLYRKMKPIFDLSYVIVPYGIRDFSIKKKRQSKTLKFGYLGALIPQKGWQLLIDAFRKVRSEHNQIELHMFGAGEQPKSLEEFEADKIFFHGEYGYQDLPKVFEKFDIGVIPSLFPETYSIVLSEMFYAGKPVCVSRLGALDERVIDGISGKKFNPADSSDLVTALSWFVTCDDWKKFQLPTPVMVPEMIESMWSLYE